MPRRDRPARTTENELRHLAPEDQRERKTRILTQGTPSVVRSIAEAVIVKDGNIFFLATPKGDVPLGGKHGFGLYYNDCRFLNGYDLTIAQTSPSALVSTAALGYKAVFQLANQDIELADGTFVLKETIGIKWERTVDSEMGAVHDLITIENFGLDRIEFPIRLAFEAEFEPIFSVRGLFDEQLGVKSPPFWRDGVLSFAYAGADGLHRSLIIHVWPAPTETDATTARFDIALRPRESTRILVSLVLAESTDAEVGRQHPEHQPDLPRIEALLQRSVNEWLGHPTEIFSDSKLLDEIVGRSMRDLHILRSRITGHSFLAAGIPWFGTLFGRDSVLTALQMLAFDPAIAENTLRLLATYQGQSTNDWHDEQPGKILHEIRIDELARTGEVPYNPPYYGTVDATPLFLILLARHAAWTGSLSLFQELRRAADLALDWLAKHGDRVGDGFLGYHSVSEDGLINQGWKDSGDAIVNADGSLATPPIALVEVQGYAYLARLLIADLYERAGEAARAEQLRREAADLRAHFNHDFWLEDIGYFALALQAGGKPAAVVSSNPGHALWSGIVDSAKASRIVERLMADDMFNGWGIRTLSVRERRYNPVGYHLGTVWPHDNAIIAAGLRRYGFDDAARQIFNGIVEASMHFEYHRLPEVFAGFPRAEYSVPVRFPVACHPQSWAAGSVPYLLKTLLGLVPHAFDHRLHIVRPMLPDFTNYLEIRHLRVGQACVDLGFERLRAGVAVQVLHVDGPLEVIVEPMG